MAMQGRPPCEPEHWDRSMQPQERGGSIARQCERLRSAGKTHHKESNTPMAMMMAVAPVIIRSMATEAEGSPEEKSICPNGQREGTRNGEVGALLYRVAACGICVT